MKQPDLNDGHVLLVPRHVNASPAPAEMRGSLVFFSCLCSFFIEKRPTNNSLLKNPNLSQRTNTIHHNKKKLKGKKVWCFVSPASSLQHKNGTFYLSIYPICSVCISHHYFIFLGHSCIFTSMKDAIKYYIIIICLKIEVVVTCCKFVPREETSCVLFEGVGHDLGSRGVEESSAPHFYPYEPWSCWFMWLLFCENKHLMVTQRRRWTDN